MRNKSARAESGDAWDCERGPEWQEGEHQRLKMWVTRFFGPGLALAEVVFRVPYSGCCPCVWAVGCHLCLWHQRIFIYAVPFNVDSSFMPLGSRSFRTPCCLHFPITYSVHGKIRCLPPRLQVGTSTSNCWLLTSAGTEYFGST